MVLRAFCNLYNVQLSESHLVHFFFSAPSCCAFPIGLLVFSLAVRAFQEIGLSCFVVLARLIPFVGLRQICVFCYWVYLSYVRMAEKIRHQQESQSIYAGLILQMIELFGSFLHGFDVSFCLAKTSAFQNKIVLTCRVVVRVQKLLCS